VGSAGGARADAGGRASGPPRGSSATTSPCRVEESEPDAGDASARVSRAARGPSRGASQAPRRARHSSSAWGAECGEVHETRRSDEPLYGIAFHRNAAHRTASHSAARRNTARHRTASHVLGTHLFGVHFLC